MHVLAATPGRIDTGDGAIDLGQTPGDIVVLSTADSELACLARAAQRLAPDRPRVRLANLLQLQHPYSVDLYVEKIVSKARFVGVSLLGGHSYWPYGIDEIAAVARANGIAFAAFESRRDADPALDAASTVPPAMLRQCARLVHEGGVANSLSFLKLAARLAGFDSGAPSPPQAVPMAGIYRKDTGAPTLADAMAHWTPGRPRALVVFYRALTLGGATDAIDSLIAALEARGLDTLAVYVRSLRSAGASGLLGDVLDAARPDVILNATAFAASSAGEPRRASVLERADCPILQAVFSGMDEDAWRTSRRGLGIRDLAMNVVLPEVDGRIFTRAVAFKSAVAYDPLTECNIARPRITPDRLAFVADLARRWARLGRTPDAGRRVALILANYPNSNGRIGNGVGLDTPASAAAIIGALAATGHAVGDAPRDGAALMAVLTSGVTNDRRTVAAGGIAFSLAAYDARFDALPAEARRAVRERWGAPDADPHFHAGAFRIAAHRFGNLLVAIQPARGYEVDPAATYHDPALPPPHYYLAFHFWLQQAFDPHAVVHVGKHGNLEWLPGKSVSLSAACFPEIGAGPVPQFYPFIVNDPGEGTQAKRRIGAVILDHLTPPLTRAETYGTLREIEALVDEYYLAAGMDPRRLALLRKRILDLAATDGLAEDAGASGTDDDALAAIDNYLCELKERQIRDGLHVFGQSPAAHLRRDLLIALARAPRGRRAPGEQSLLRALAEDLGLGFDPLDCHMGAPWSGPRPAALATRTPDLWRTTGDTVERLELLAIALVEGAPPPGPASRAVMAEVRDRLAPKVDACGPAEMQALIDGLRGRFVAPGPSGAPTRGRPDVLPTGRNFFSVDSRTVPTATAWDLGWRSAQMLVQDYLQKEGCYPKAIALTAWGTSNMRTGGDDVAQALALMGVRPQWDWTSGRVTGFEIMPLAELGRPRVDVTLRISGFFRDAFPEQIDLLDSAARAVMALDEGADDNPAAARMTAEERKLRANGAAPAAARAEAGARIFGSMPGTYGAGLDHLIEGRNWSDRADLASTYLDWGGHVYGSYVEGAPARDLFARRLSEIDAVVQNQDNHEHDLFDSDDYYQFEGGLHAAVEAQSGRTPRTYHNDHSRPERPRIRTLEEEVGRVVRARLVNPKWIAGVMRHGYKGAFEIAASVDYLFAIAATTGAVRNHHFDAVHAAFIEDDAVRAFMEESNPTALRDLAARLLEALDRGLWQARSNSAAVTLGELAQAGHNGRKEPHDDRDEQRAPHREDAEDAGGKAPDNGRKDH